MTQKTEMHALRAQVAKGAGLIGAARIAFRMLGFINTIIVARLLAPQDFGLVAIAVTTMQLLQGLSDVGVSQAVIRFRDADRRDLDTLFTLSVIRGGVVAAILLAAAPFAAEIYDDPRVGWVFIGVSVYPMALALVNPKFFEFERDLDFSKEFWASTLNKLAGVIVSVAIAFAFRSYWAIILGLVTGGVVQLIVSYAMQPYRPRLSLASMSKVFSFSSWIFGVSFLAALNNKIDSLIVARFAGSADAGVYYVGQQLADLPTSEIASPFARAIYPGFSSLSGRPSEMKAAYLQGVEALGAVALPAALGFAFLAGDIIVLLIGDKWLSAAPVVQILAPVTGLQTLFFATQFYAIANDKTKYIFFRELAFFLFRTPIFFWATIEHGLLGAAYAGAGAGLFHVAMNTQVYARISRGRTIDPFWAARRSIAGALAMAFFFLFVNPLLPWPADPSFVTLIVKLGLEIAVGGLIYVAVQAALWRAEGRPDGIETAVLSFARSRLA